jgi:uncharacterized protein YndB with AHSA1/START domain
MTETHFIVEPGKHAITITRVFDAPRELVFKAYTDPELLPQWWGPRKYTTTVERMEVRPGGIWRYIQRGPDGDEHAFHGVYHEAVSPERLIYTFEYEGMPGHVSLETVTLQDQAGKTLVTDQVIYQSVEDRDGMYQSGMQEGAIESMDRFAELLVRV